MKKNLLFTGALALFMASCSQTEFEQIDATSKVEGKGVSFAASISEDAGTRAAYKPFQNVFNHNWYADKDKIGVFYKKGTSVGVKNSQNALEIGSSTGWMGLDVSSESHSFEFKATASGTQGYFVANGDDNTLWLKAPVDPEAGYSDVEKPVFRAYWPLEAASRTDYAVGTEINISTYASATQAQSTTDGHGIAEKAFMVSESDTKSTYDANDNSVAKDRFSLEFKRISPIVYFKIKTGGSNDPALNREYERDYAEGLFTRFGKLKTVKLEAKGSQEAGTSLSTPSNLTFNDGATWNIAAENVYDPKTAFTDSGTGASPKITTTMGGGSGLDWSNDAVAFMVIANVDRSAYREAQEEEEVTATYTFENIQLETSVRTSKDWAFTGDKAQWIGFPTQEGYNLDNEPYLAYEYTTGEYVLEVNPSFDGKLADLFDGDNLNGLKKGDGSAIEKNDIKHFVSKVNITAAEDFAVIKSLSSLTNVTLLENTTIPAEAFKGLISLVYLNLPKVTTVADINAFPANSYAEVYMGSYDFSDKEGTNQTAVRDLLLTQANLKKADISAVANIAAGFPTSGVTFTGFSALTEITVKPGAIIGGAAFKDCTTLETVQFPKGVVGVSVYLEEGANSQFMNCAALTTISIGNTVIPDMAFNGCTTLKTILGSDGKAIVPTAIGEGAFSACEAIVDMDLSKAATIGTSAFEGCISLEGNNSINAARTVLYVNAITHVSDYAFKGCTALQYISFANATTIGVNILEGVNCKEIEFLKPFTVNSTIATGSSTEFFGTTTSTKLFCAKAQTGISVNTITLTGNAQGSVAASTVFGNGITKYAQ